VEVEVPRHHLIPLSPFRAALRFRHDFHYTVPSMAGVNVIPLTWVLSLGLAIVGIMHICIMRICVTPECLFVLFYLLSPTSPHLVLSLHFYVLRSRFHIFDFGRWALSL
jgi:hypothetical protein